MTRNLTIFWDDQSAEYRYRLTTTNLDADLDDYPVNSYIDGDLEWAKRIAAHYNLKVPEAGEDDEEA